MARWEVGVAGGDREKGRDREGEEGSSVGSWFADRNGERSGYGGYGKSGIGNGFAERNGKRGGFG